MKSPHATFDKIFPHGLVNELDSVSENLIGGYYFRQALGRIQDECINLIAIRLGADGCLGVQVVIRVENCMIQL